MPLDLLISLAYDVGLLALVSLVYTVLLRRLSSRPRLFGVACGLLFGAAGGLAMLHPTTLAPGVVLDARSVMLALAGLFGSWPATVVSAVIIGAYRLWLGGVGAPAGVAGVLIVAATGLLFMRLRRPKDGVPHFPDLLLLGLLSGPLQMTSTLLLPSWELTRQVAFGAGPALIMVNVLGILLLGTMLSRERLRLGAEQALRKSETLFRAVFDNSTDSLFINKVEPDGSFTLSAANPAARAAMDKEGAEMPPFLAAPRIDAELRRCLDLGAPISFESSQTLGGGHRLWETTLIPIRDPFHDPAHDGGRIVFIYGSGRDITHREQARRVAEQANKAKGEFLAGLSHELRTPLNSVIGFSDLIAKETEGPVGAERYKTYATNIRDSGEHLLELINEILDHAKVEAGMLTVEEDELDLEAAVTFALRMLTPRAKGAGVSLSSSVAPTARFLRADERRIRQILLNLVSNAVKYTPSGGQVSVTAVVGEDGALVLTVADNGIGIAEEDLKHVLEAFSRVGGATGRRIEGTGLGLPLTRRLVELHGGELTLRSSPGNGTTVAVRLPAGRVMEGPSPAAAAGDVPSAGAVHRARGLAILLVEDDALIRMATVTALWHRGHRVFEAANANEAIGILHGPEAIDLLFSDMVMPPGMSGAELAREAERLRPGIPVLLTSGVAGQAVAGGAGMDPYQLIPKPYTLDDLLQRIEGLCAPAPGSQCRAARILLVEDVVLNQQLASLLLTAAGHSVDVVDDGAAAVAAVQQSRYDLVLMDVHMKGMDGLEATRTIRGLAPPIGGMPILAMTASNGAQEMEQCRLAGMDGYIMKPIDRPALLAAVERWARPKPAPGAAGCS